MQRLTAIAISDPSLLQRFLQSHQGSLDAASDLRRGAWGVGFERRGEILVNKCPLTRRFDALRQLSGISARHVLVVVDGFGPTSEPSAPTMEFAQPIRFRDWLVGVSGLVGLGSEFVTRVDSEVEGLLPRPRALSEAAALTIMDSIYRAGLLDLRTPRLARLREVLPEALERLEGLAGIDGLAVALQIRGHSFFMSKARPLWTTFFEGLGEPGGGWSAQRTARHLRTWLLTDWEPEASGTTKRVPEGEGVWIDEACRARPFALG